MTQNYYSYNFLSRNFLVTCSSAELNSPTLPNFVFRALEPLYASAKIIGAKKSAEDTGTSKLSRDYEISKSVLLRAESSKSKWSKEVARESCPSKSHAYVCGLESGEILKP